jgi:hypothetical protein
MCVCMYVCVYFSAFKKQVLNRSTGRCVMCVCNIFQFLYMHIYIDKNDTNCTHIHVTVDRGETLHLCMYPYTTCIQTICIHTKTTKIAGKYTCLATMTRHGTYACIHIHMHTYKNNTNCRQIHVPGDHD